jgi:hypothetical protein
MAYLTLAARVTLVLGVCFASSLTARPLTLRWTGRAPRSARDEGWTRRKRLAEARLVCRQQRWTHQPDSIQGPPA